MLKAVEGSYHKNSVKTLERHFSIDTGPPVRPPAGKKAYLIMDWTPSDPAVEQLLMDSILDISDEQEESLSPLSSHEELNKFW